MSFRWFPTPPLVSPTATPALGVGLSVNTMLLILFYVLMDRFATHPEPFVQEIRQYGLALYAALCVAVAFLYGLAAAAWTGWSWWRVPWATLAGCGLGWCANVLIASYWAHLQRWEVASTLAWSGPHTRTLWLCAIAALLLLLSIWATIFNRNKPLVVE